MNVLREREPLLEGESKSSSFWLPQKLKDALKADSLLDDYKSLNAYVVDLLLFAIKTRRAERAAKAALDAQKK